MSDDRFSLAFSPSVIVDSERSNAIHLHATKRKQRIKNVSLVALEVRRFVIHSTFIASYSCMKFSSILSSYLLFFCNQSVVKALILSMSNNINNQQCESDRLQLWHGKVRLSASFSLSLESLLSLFFMQWTNQQIGWHESDVHGAIRQYEETLLFPDITTTPKRILFPLCGKTVDMAYLATKYSEQLQIVGVDGVAQALETFVKEQEHLKLEKQVDSNRWMNSNLELLQSDFFQMTQDNYQSYHHSSLAGGNFTLLARRLCPSLSQIVKAQRQDPVDCH